MYDSFVFNRVHACHVYMYMYIHVMYVHTINHIHVCTCMYIYIYIWSTCTYMYMYTRFQICQINVVRYILLLRGVYIDDGRCDRALKDKRDTH